MKFWFVIPTRGPMATPEPDGPAFAGTCCRFADVAFAPGPVQKPHPPICALRRPDHAAHETTPADRSARLDVAM